jgi:hypothetical protein
LDKWTARVREFIVERVPDAALILGGAANVMFYEGEWLIQNLLAIGVVPLT